MLAKEKMVNDLSVELNPAQIEAVECTEGPLLVIAAAGTGKTKTLVSRIHHLIVNKGVPGYRILAVTFTNKAAQEMRDRLYNAIGEEANDIFIGTFHQISLRLLRKYYTYANLPSNFVIIDEQDQIRIVKSILQEEGLDPKSVSPKSITYTISRWKDDGLLPHQVQANTWEERRVLKIYHKYQEMIERIGALDFGDLILKFLNLVISNEEVLSKIQNLFQYFMVDEYQDINTAQYLWLKSMVPDENPNLCCVGDDDQSIYGWRGAKIINILRFERDFLGAKVIRLEKNYRSTGHILAAASNLVDHNNNRYSKKIWTDSEMGEKVVVNQIYSGEEEATWVSKKIMELTARGEYSFGEIAILIRAGYQSRLFEEIFVSYGLPYRMYGGMNFYDHLEIRDSLAYLKLINRPEDHLSFLRIINTPRRGIGDKTLGTLEELISSEESFTKALEIWRNIVLKGSTKHKVEQFLSMVNKWRERSTMIPPSDLLQEVLEESGYLEMWKADPHAMSRVENLEELVNALKSFNDLETFLDHISLVHGDQSGKAENKIVIATIHTAKGLEFKCVFLVGWEEGVFPSTKAATPDQIEEERRLAYVAITRARERAFISCARRRQVFGQWEYMSPSRFINELPSENIQSNVASTKYYFD